MQCSSAGWNKGLQEAHELTHRKDSVLDGSAHAVHIFRYEQFYLLVGQGVDVYSSEPWWKGVCLRLWL